MHMNLFDFRSVQFTLNAWMYTAALLIVAILLWATGVPMLLKSANAAALTDVSDTLTDSDLGVASGHTLEFTLSSTIDAAGTADTLVVRLDPETSAFQILDLDATDFVGETGLTVVANAGACAGGTEMYLSATTTEGFTLTMCTTDSIATSTTIILPIASSTSVITNPASGNSYIIHIETLNAGAIVLDQADTRVVIIDDVTVTAAVATTFEFTINGLASGTDVNGETTSTTTSATAIGFGTLTPGSSVVGGQRLNVETNARNGFTVTVKQDQNLTSATGADIDPFAQGQGQFTPIAWVAPANTLGSENTYGHFGITSEDATLDPTGPLGADPFGAQLFAGNFSTTTLEVFFHDGPADNTTAGVGETDVAYQIEVESLQEAGTDYTATLTYVATPTF